MTKYNVTLEYTTDNLDAAMNLGKHIAGVTFFSIEDISDEEYTDVDDVDVDDEGVE